jgi:hypothetical protein
MGDESEAVQTARSNEEKTENTNDLSNERLAIFESLNHKSGVD